MHPFLLTKKSSFDAVLDHLEKELGSLRTGRATPALVENVMVMAYDAPMDLKSVASIGAQDTKTLVIDPWDKSLLQAIEKGIRDAGLGFSPVVDGTIVRISLPELTEENRRNLVKLMKEKLEESRIAIRGVREDVRQEILKMEKAKTLSEDERFKLLDETDKQTKDYTARIDAAGEKKEAEIMKI